MLPFIFTCVHDPVNTDDRIDSRSMAHKACSQTVRGSLTTRVELILQIIARLSIRSNLFLVSFRSIAVIYIYISFIVNELMFLDSMGLNSSKIFRWNFFSMIISIYLS